MKKILTKIYSWLALSNPKDKLFEKKIRNQLRVIIGYLLYPEFRKSKIYHTSFHLKGFIYNNKYKLSIFTGLLLICGLFYYMGYNKSSKKIEKLESKLEIHKEYNTKLLISVAQKDSTISSMEKTMGSREFLEHKIIKDFKIKKVNGLKDLNDDIFFLMVSEIEKNKIPPVIFYKVVERESGFRFISNYEGSGAMGYMQIMPGTFNKYYKKMGLKGGHNQINNIKVGTKLLRNLYNKWDIHFNDDRKIWEYALAEYACGGAPMQIWNSDKTKVIGYHIPNKVRPGIDKVMKHY